MYIESYKELIVWQRSIQLVKAIYIFAAKLPQTELYALADQMKRAAVSIPSNIAEGKKRRSKKDFVHFLRIADGSAAELETQLIIAKELYPKLDFFESEKLLNEVQKMLSTIIRKLEA